MGGLLRDLRIASRALRKSPAFTTVAIVVLALGIGLSTTVYTILDGVLRQPLPYPEPDRLVMIWDVSRDDPSQRSVVAPGSVEDWQEQSGSFEAIALYNLISLTIAAEDERRRADGIVVTPEYFDVVRIAPALGRPLTRPADDDGGATPMVISHAFWRDRFGGRPEAIGRSIDTGSGEFEVVGVMPEGYRGPEEFVLGPSSFWIPFPSTLGEEGRGARYLRAVARLGPGVSIEGARRRLAGVADRLSEQFPDTNEKWTTTVVGLHDEIVRDGRPALRLLAAAVALVQLTVCANLASLLLSRGVTRQRENALRIALGAPRARLMATVMAEALIIAAAGAGGGLLIAGWTLGPLLSLAPTLPRSHAVTMSAGSVIFACGLAGLTAFAVSLVPSVAAARVPPSFAIQNAGRGASEGPGRRRLRQALAGAELAMSLTLLVAAALLTRSFSNLMRIDPGFRADGVLMARVELAEGPESNARALLEAADAVRRMPDVVEAGFASSLPLHPLNNMRFPVTIRTAGGETDLEVRYRAVTAGYFQAMGMRLKSGRLLRHTDHAGAPGAAVISDAAAARLAARDPVGGKVWFEFGGREFSGAIVGVVHGSRSMDLMTQPEPEVYVPYEQHPVMDTMFLAARAKERRAAALPLRAVVGRVAPRAVVEDVQEFRTLVHRSAAASRLNMVLVGTLAGAALLLAAIGLYAIVADHVAMRGREMGIRLALGARAASVLRLVLRDALQTALAGIAVGILAAYVLTVVLRAWLFGVGPHDPLTFAGVSALLLVVSLVATYLPARRAARVDPVIALREDG